MSMVPEDRRTRSPLRPRAARALLRLAAVGLALAGTRPDALAFRSPALPGSSWGRASHDMGDDVAGTGIMGFVNQGVDWAGLPGGTTLNTFTEFRHRVRTENNDFYNAYGQALGVDIRRSSLHLGANYFWERFPEIQRDSDKFQYYLHSHNPWDLKPALGLELPVLGLSGSTWNRLTYDADSLIGAGAMGFVNQGIDWTVLPGGVVLNTYAEFQYRLRDKNNRFYNAYGPSLGLELRKASLRLGLGYYWERFSELEKNSNKLQAYLAYYCDWDLRDIEKLARR